MTKNDFCGTKIKFNSPLKSYQTLQPMEGSPVFKPKLGIQSVSYNLLSGFHLGIQLIFVRDQNVFRAKNHFTFHFSSMRLYSMNVVKGPILITY